MKNAENPENSGQSEGQFLCNPEPWTKLVDGAILVCTENLVCID